MPTSLRVDSSGNLPFKILKYRHVQAYLQVLIGDFCGVSTDFEVEFAMERFDLPLDQCLPPKEGEPLLHRAARVASDILWNLCVVLNEATRCR
jgi:hypothetical protein